MSEEAALAARDPAIGPIDPETGRHRRVFAPDKSSREAERIAEIERERRKAEWRAELATRSVECSGFGMPLNEPKHKECRYGPEYCLCACHDPLCACSCHHQRMPGELRFVEGWT